MRLYFNFQSFGIFIKQLLQPPSSWSLWFAIINIALLPPPLFAQITTEPNNESVSKSDFSPTTTTITAQSLNNSNKSATLKAKPQQDISSNNAAEWMSLDKKSQQFLLPLKSIWQDLSKLQQRKWLAIAAQSRKMSTTENEILHQRMRDWALLSSSEREKARLNFNKVNQLSQEEKLKNWQAYQALSSKEKASLAKNAQIQKGLALQNASNAVQSKNKTLGIQVNQSASPQHPAIANNKISPSTASKAATNKPEIQTGTLLPQISTP